MFSVELLMFLLNTVGKNEKYGMYDLSDSDGCSITLRGMGLMRCKE